jgi:hypothetical protein
MKQNSSSSSSSSIVVLCLKQLRYCVPPFTVIILIKYFMFCCEANEDFDVKL